MGREEDVLAVHIVGDCTMMCKVGFLPQHLAVRADVYDGLYARIVSIYSDRCTNMLMLDSGKCIDCLQRS